MKYFLTFSLTVLIFSFSLQTNAQSAQNNFSTVDNYVKSLGSLDTLNMGTISYLVTKKFTDPKEKVRAIFDWIAYNINYDLKAGKNNNNEKTSTELVLKLRKATAVGFAALFQDMCSVVKIRCLTVDGYAKFTTEQIVEKPEELNHTWAVVQLGQSPDSWYYVDPTWASGYTDDKMTKFTKAFNSDYFFADKNIFNYQHFPDNGAWLIGEGTRSSSAFFAMPLVKSAAYEFKLGKFLPANGFIKTKLSKPLSFNIKLNTNIAIEIVSLEMGENKKKKTKTVDFTFSDGNLSFSHKFDMEDTYPVTVLVNNKPVLGYLVEVSE